MTTRVRTHIGYWKAKVIGTHPSMAGKEGVAKEALESPIEIRESKKNNLTYLFYRIAAKRFVCVVVKKVQESSGFVVTAYETDQIKTGVLVWKKM